MLKITAIGNLTNDVELKMNESTGKPYAILRIASDRRYRDQAGNRLTDFISIKVRGPLAERCAAFAWKGCKLAAVGDFETITFEDDPARQPGDTGIVYSESTGYHIMYFVGYDLPYWQVQVTNDLVQDAVDTFYEEKTADYTAEQSSWGMSFVG